MAIVYQKTKGLTDAELHYCPGCHHGIIHKLVAEVLEEMGLLDDAIGVCPVGCSVFAYKYFNCDMQEAAHGRAPAVATGIKRTHPTQPVFTYQGDGDLASIGAAEIVHAAMRGEKATTCPLGRTVEQAGMPIRVAEMLSTLDGCVYAERVCVTDIAHLNKAKKAIRKAFEKQMAGEGFTFVEVLSTCPTNWGMTPLKAKEWLEEKMIPYYPLGVIKETGAEVK